MGKTEIRYLNSLPPRQRNAAFRRILEFKIPCIVLTNDNTIAQDLLDDADAKGIPVLGTPFETTTIAYFLADFLDDQFAPQTVIHGSLVDVYGVGVLIMGRSGIGKSEIALDLVERGHRLVADDIVTITKRHGDVLIGSGNQLLRHHMEIRGRMQIRNFQLPVLNPTSRPVR